MIRFDAVEFSERRSEEVMFLLTVIVVTSYVQFFTCTDCSWSLGHLDPITTRVHKQLNYKSANYK